MKKEFLAFNNVLAWMDENRPLEVQRQPEMLLSFSTGLYNTDLTINPDKIKEVGMAIQENLDNGNFTTKISTKAKIKPLSHLKHTILINEQETVFDPLKLFNRLIIISEREISIKESLRYELTPLPMTLFEDTQFMRKTDKAAFGTHLKKLIVSGNQKVDSFDVTVIDGGWLIHQIPWKTSETYEEIFQSYIKFVKNICTSSTKGVVIFDGYSVPSTKDHEHQRRQKYMCSNIKIDLSKKLLISKIKFLDNNNNKSAFINGLADALTIQKIDTIQSEEDADTLIVKTALDLSKTSTVNVIADDTDILVILLHHINNNRKPIYLTRKGRLIDMQELSGLLNEAQKQFLLLAYSFSGCDTVSAIHNYGKIKLFNKLTKGNCTNVLEVFTNPQSAIQCVKDAGVKLFEYIYRKSTGKTSMHLNDIRYHNFMKMTARGKICPERLPPTKGAAEQHSLRAYLQLQDWIQLKPKSLDPALFGWTLKHNIYKPVGFIGPIAPQGLLKLISCGCKTDCKNNICSCVKNGLKCVSACGECHGLSCKNTVLEDSNGGTDTFLEDDNNDGEDYLN